MGCVKGESSQWFVSSSKEKKWTFLTLPKTLMQSFQEREIKRRFNLDHTSQFGGFWSPKARQCNRWRYMAFICFVMSTILLLQKVACRLLVCPCFVARGVVLSIPLCALARRALSPLTKRYLFSFLLKVASLSHSYGLQNITSHVSNGATAHSTSST